MSFFRKKEKSVKEETSVEKKRIGLVIHLTPIAIYLYISENGTVSSYLNGSRLHMEDLEGNYIGINGSYITLALSNESEIENTILKFGLKNANLPIIKTKVRDR